MATIEELKKLKVEFWANNFIQSGIRKKAEREIKQLKAEARYIRKKFDVLNKELGANDHLYIYETALMEEFFEKHKELLEP